MISDEYDEGSLIRMADGSQRCVQDIRIGDKVMTKDGSAVEITDIWRGMSETKKKEAISVMVFNLEYNSEAPLYNDDF